MLANNSHADGGEAAELVQRMARCTTPPAGVEAGRLSARPSGCGRRHTDGKGGVHTMTRLLHRNRNSLCVTCVAGTWREGAICQGAQKADGPMSASALGPSAREGDQA